jgi:D-alanyl-D-alanine carboxypeptidase
VTAFLGSTAVALTLLVGGHLVTAGNAAAARGRAQLAADAAALAAVTESSVLGTGRPRAAAARYATANGAQLVSCECPPGATTMRVEVSVDGTTARAGAELDPGAVAPASFTGEGLHPLVETALHRLISAAEGRVHLVSGYRSSRRQQQLWDAAVAKYGSAELADDWVARPGSSMHERGLAVDLGGDVEMAARLVESLGLPLHRPLPNEPWHFELRIGGP